MEGGTFTMGQVEDDLTGAWDNIPRRVTVSSFYMDEVEVTNYYWLEYLFWLNRVYGDGFPEIVDRAKPDTLCGGTPGPTTSLTSTITCVTPHTGTTLSWASPGCRPMNSASGGPTASMSKSWCGKVSWCTTQPGKWTTASLVPKPTSMANMKKRPRQPMASRTLRPNGVGYRNVA